MGKLLGREWAGTGHLKVLNQDFRPSIFQKYFCLERAAASSPGTSSGGAGNTANRSFDGMAGTFPGTSSGGSQVNYEEEAFDKHDENLNVDEALFDPEIERAIVNEDSSG